MTFAIELSPGQSKRILECACRAHHSVRLSPKSWIESPAQRVQPATPAIQCKLVEYDDEALELETPRLGSTDFKSLLNIYCQIELELQDGQYFFDSHIVAVRQRSRLDPLRGRDAGVAGLNPPGADVCLMLAWPGSILVKQRRRSGRLALARSSTVQLSRHQGERLESFEGQLYNLSEDGLAFQLPKRDAEKLQDGQTGCACFEVPQQDHCYKFEGLICRVLPSSSQDSVIVAMHFDLSAGAAGLTRCAGDRRELSDLREFLTNRLYGMAAVGGTP